jgi:hypothetical protein
MSLFSGYIELVIEAMSALVTCMTMTGSAFWDMQVSGQKHRRLFFKRNFLLIILSHCEV